MVYTLVYIIEGGNAMNQINTTTAKLFINGRSQAVRLPKEYRFEGTEVFIHRDPITGDIVLSRRPSGPWKDFFALADRSKVPADFLRDRRDAPPQKRDLF